jgi:hypothetical protein
MNSTFRNEVCKWKWIIDVMMRARITRAGKV